MSRPAENEKKCQNCNKVFVRPIGYSFFNWYRRKFCSKTCQYVYKSKNTSWCRRGIANNMWKGGQVTLVCRICEMEFKVDPYRRETAKTCSQICQKEYRKSPGFRLSQSEIHRRLAKLKFGKLMGLYDTLDKIIRHSSQYKLWRQEVFKKDNFTCVTCGVRGGVLRADHIKQFAQIISEYQIKSLEHALLCGELWDINNGRTLCNNCHLLTPTYGRKIISNISTKKITWIK